MKYINPYITKYVVHCKKFPCDVYVGRPSKWGNPFSIGKHGDRNEVILKYLEYILANQKLKEDAKKELKGKILGCWCSPKPCHADILAIIANDPKVELTYDYINTELLYHGSEDCRCKTCGALITLFDKSNNTYCENGHLHDN